mgnify:CR=1 FL=1
MSNEKSDFKFNFSGQQYLFGPLHDEIPEIEKWLEECSLRNGWVVKEEFDFLIELFKKNYLYLDR